MEQTLGLLQHIPVYSTSTVSFQNSTEIPLDKPLEESLTQFLYGLLKDSHIS